MKSVLDYCSVQKIELDDAIPDQFAENGIQIAVNDQEIIAENDQIAENSDHIISEKDKEIELLKSTVEEYKQKLEN